MGEDRIRAHGMDPGAGNLQPVSDKELHQLFDGAPYGVLQYELRDDGALVLVGYNAAADRILGTDHRHLLDRPIGESLPAPAGTLLSTAFNEAVFRGGVFDAVHVRFPALAGVKQLEATAIRTGVRRVAVFVRDPNDRQRTDEDLRESEERFRTLVNNIPGVVFRCELKAPWRVEFVSGAIVPLTGYSQRDLLDGRVHFADIISPEDVKAVERALTYAVTTRQPFELEFRIVCANEGVRWVSFKGIAAFEHRGMPRHLDGVMIDITEQKRAERSLRESEERFREMADLLPQAVYETDAAGRITFANRHGTVLFGYTAEDIAQGLNILEFVDPAERDRAQANMAKLLQGEDVPGGREYAARRKDGTQFPVAVFTSVVIRDERPAGVRGILFDLTERKRAEEENALRAKLLNNATDAILLLDAQANFLYFNEALCSMTGYSREELAARDLKDIEPPDYAERIASNIAMLRERGHAVFESAYLRKDGTVVPIEVHARAMTYAGQPAVLSVVRDISERKRLEQVLLQAKNDWETTFDTITDMITIHDENFTIVRANKAASVLLGLPWINTARAKCYEYYHDTDTPPVDCPSCESVQTQKPSLSERYEPHLGKYLEIRAIPRFDEEGNMKGLIHVVRDITQRKKGERELVELEARLREAQRMEVIGNIAGGVAHEVRNPLNAIMALSDAMARELGDAPGFQAYVGHLRSQVARLTALMQDLLELGRPVSQEGLRPEPLIAIFRTALDAWRGSVLGQGRDAELSAGEDELVVRADARRLQQVMINLLDNAVQHSPEGGPVRIEVARMPGGRALVRVIDRGSGIEPNLLPRVFDTFFTTRRTGTGLGLSIVKYILERHGGTVRVLNNEPPPGCTVEFELPLEERQIA